MDIRLKKLKYQSTYRGTRELDYVFGRFAQHELDHLTTSELNIYEAFITEPETDLAQWIFHNIPCPKREYHPFLDKMRDTNRIVN